MGCICPPSIAAGRFLLAEFIYTMRKTRKAHGDKVILDDVTLNFLPGAKIGVVGPNGAGKSTVLKIMAGLEQPSNGDAFLSPGFTRRHPHAGAAARRVEDRAGERPGRRRRDHGQAHALQRGRRAHGDGLLRRAHGGDGQAPGGPGPRQRVGPGRPAGAGHGRPGLPARRLARHQPLRWREAPRRALQAADRGPGPAPARRAHQPPRRRVGELAGAAPLEVRGRRRRRHPRPVLPEQRRRVDPRAGPRPRASRTRATTPRTWTRRPPVSRSRAARTRSAPSGSRKSWSGSAPTPRAGRPSPRPVSPGTRRWRPRRTRCGSWTSRRSRSRRARGSVPSSSRSTTSPRRSATRC